MFIRTRDPKRQNIRPQGTISYKAWEEAVNKYNNGIAFFQETNIVYITMRNKLNIAKDAIWNNRIHESHEVKTITDTFKKIFIIPKQEQVDELVGQFKFITFIFGEVQKWIDYKEELEKQEADGIVTIQRDVK